MSYALTQPSATTLPSSSIAKHVIQDATDGSGRLAANPQSQQGGLERQGFPLMPGANHNSFVADASTDSEAATPIDEHELIALVVEMRLRDSRSTKSPSRRTDEPGPSSVSADSSAIDTLDLCHRRIEEVPEALMEILHDEVVRLALGYNQISRLPDNFAQLHLLRYLNIRSNNFSVFPEVLCNLPALEILEFSRNKIRKLPAEPKRLIFLRVLSMSHNRLRALPPWLPQMKQLRILKLDQNPIEWPPPHISVMPAITKAPLPIRDDKEKVEDLSNSKEAIISAKKKAEERHMHVWISQVKRWITEDLNRKSQHLTKGFKDGKDADGAVGPLQSSEERLDSAAVPLVDQSRRNRMPLTLEPSALGNSVAHQAVHTADGSEVVTLLRTPPADEDTTPKASSTPPDTTGSTSINEKAAVPNLRSGAQEHPSSSPSISAIPHVASNASQSAANTPQLPTITNAIERHTSPPPPPPNLHIEPVPRMPALYSPHASPLAQSNSQSRWDFGPALDTLRPNTSALQSHSRNNSYSLAQSSASASGSAVERPPLRSKKSLPDMRQSHGAILSERSVSEHQRGSESANGNGRRPSFPSNRRPAAPSISSTPAVPTVVLKSGLRELTLGKSPLSSRADEPETSPAVSPAPSTPAGNTSVDEERNSYFRRLSTLPASTISKAIPNAVLESVDATRGILFALSQIYLALKQYILFAADERAASSFNRVLEIASGNMGSFIDALDRFDSTSRRGTPEPDIIRGVLAACKDSVDMFRKVISVLQLQLRPLQSTADVRYTRTLLLMLYGSMAEIANSWHAMAPEIQTVLPFLEQLQSTISISAVKATHAAPMTTPTLPSIAETTSPAASPPTNKVFAVTSRPRRRHAGSFSAQDVAHGASMGAQGLPASPSKSDDHPRSRNLPRGRAASNANTGYVPPVLGHLPPMPYSSGRSENGSFREDNSPYDGSGTPNSFVHHNGYDSPDMHEMPFRGIGSSSRSNRSPSIASGSSASEGQYRWEREASIGSNVTVTGTTRHVIDDHLLLLVQQVTSIASSVWLTLSDHLNTIFPSSTAGAASRAISPSPSSAGPTSTPSSSALRKLRDLRDLATSASDLTRRLQGTFRKVSNFASGDTDLSHNQLDIDEASTSSSFRGPSPSFSLAGEAMAPEALARRLWDEANQFVRAVIPISQLIKSSSTEHAYPRELTRPLGELATGCSELLLHMHFLNPSPQSISAAGGGGGSSGHNGGIAAEGRTTVVVPPLPTSGYPFPTRNDRV